MELLLQIAIGLLVTAIVSGFYFCVDRYLKIQKENLELKKKISELEQMLSSSKRLNFECLSCGSLNMKKTETFSQKTYMSNYLTKEMKTVPLSDPILVFTCQDCNETRKIKSSKREKYHLRKAQANQK